MPIVVKHVDDMGFLCGLSVNNMDDMCGDANDMGSWRIVKGCCTLSGC